MTEKKRFHFGYVLGDTGLIDEQAEVKWFIENCCSVSDLKKNWITVCNKLNELAEENNQLKQQLLANTDESVCILCKHMYTVKKSSSRMKGYHIAKCEKGHEKCSKEDVRYCKDFEFKELKRND